MLFLKLIRNVVHKIHLYKKQESFGETRSHTADYRIPGISISTVKLQDARRQNKVTKLIEMFGKHLHKEQFLKDMSQKQDINKFSEESQRLLVDMNHTEIFELCENSAKHQCPDCSVFSEIGIIYCSCGINLKYSRSPTNNPEDHLRLYCNPWLCHQEEFQSRTKTWCL